MSEESHGVKIETLQKTESYGEESYQGAASSYDPGGSYGENPNSVENANPDTTPTYGGDEEGKQPDTAPTYGGGSYEESNQPNTAPSYGGGSYGEGEQPNTTPTYGGESYEEGEQPNTTPTYSGESYEEGEQPNMTPTYGGGSYREGEQPNTTPTYGEESYGENQQPDTGGGSYGDGKQPGTYEEEKKSTQWEAVSVYASREEKPPEKKSQWEAVSVYDKKPAEKKSQWEAVSVYDKKEKPPEKKSQWEAVSVYDKKPAEKKSQWEAVPVTAKRGNTGEDAGYGQKGLKDSKKKEDWLRVQRTTFTNWINDRLKVGKTSYSGPEVFELEVNLQDGIILARLMEILAGVKAKGINKTPKIKAHKIDNLTQVLKIMDGQKIRLVSITPEALSQGQLKLTLGLVWTLILKYQIKFKPTAKISAKKAMIVWVQAMIPGSNVTNLTSDWQSGFALLSLIDSIKPGLVPPLSTLDPSKGLSNCMMAMKIAKNHLKIPQVLNAEDIVNLNVDEISMMTYLSYFCDPAANKLLKWAQKMIPHINIKNLTTDWNDGLALAALLDARFPGVYPDAPMLQARDSYQTVERCFVICKDKMGFVPVISVKEILNPNIDELLMMSFLSAIRSGSLIALPDEIDVSGPGLESAQVGRQTSFSVDCTCGGPGKLFIDIYNTSVGKQVKHTMYESKPLVHTVKYQPNEGGDLSIEILWSGNPVPGSPYRVRVTDSAQLKVINLDSHCTTVNINQTISLDLDATKSGKGNLKAYYQYEDNEEAMTTRVQENYDQTYTLHYEFPRSGQASIHVFWNSEELQQCTVKYNIVNSEHYTLIDPPDEQLFHTMYPVKFQVQAESGVALPLLTMTASCGEIIVPLEMKAAEGCVGTASFVPTIPGEYKIEVSCANRHILGSPFMIYAVDASQCFLANTLPKTLAVGVAHEFQLETKEAGPGGATFDVEDKDVNKVFQVSAVEKGSMILFRVTPLLCGSYLASLKWSDQHISCSPFRVSVCDPSKCKVQPNLCEVKTIPVGKPLNFVVVAKGAGPGVKPVVKAQGISALYNADIDVFDQDEYSVTFVPWEVGKLEVTVLWGGHPIPNSPFELEVMGFHSGMCTAQGEGLQRALTTVPAQFVIIADQPQLIADGYLVIKVISVIKKNECKVRARDNMDGTYNIAYLAPQVGSYLISITVHGDHIPGSPFKMNAILGPDPSKCIAYGPALEKTTILNIGKPIDFSVDTHSAGNGELTVKAVGPAGALATVYTSKGDSPGVYDIRLDPIRHGKYRVSVKWSNKHIPDSPFLLKIFPGVDPTKCKAFGPGLEDREVGEPTHFIIETKNAGAGTLKVRLHGVNDAFNIDISPKDPQDVRTLQASYNPPKGGDYLITIKWDDINIPGSPFKVTVFGDNRLPMEIVHRPIPKSLSDEGFDFDDEEEDFFNEEQQYSKKTMKKSLSDSSDFDREENVKQEHMPDFGSVGKKGYQKNFASEHAFKIRSDTTTTSFPKTKSRPLSPTYGTQMYPGMPGAYPARPGGYGGMVQVRPMMPMMAPQMQVQPMRVQQKRPKRQQQKRYH